MSTRATLAWIAVAVALVAGYVYSGRMMVEEYRAAYEAKRFLDIDAASIERIGISTREHDLIEAERTGENQWRMLSPHPHIRPNHALWSQFASSIPKLIKERPIEADREELELYGLTNPPLRLTVEADGSILQLNVGRRDPTQNNRYAQLGDGEVFLMPANMAEAFYQSLDKLRDTRVLPGMEDGVDRIHYERYAVGDGAGAVEGTESIDETYVLEDDDTWKMIEPQEAVVFQNELLHLVNELGFLRGANYIDDPEALSDFGLNPPWARIEVSNSETGMNEALILGWLDDMADDGRMFASVEGSPSVFSIDASFIDRLPEAPGDYREKRLFTGEATKLSAIRYRDRNRTFALENDPDDGWALTNPPHDDTQNLLVSRFITIMKQFTGNRFADPDEAADFGEERIRYTFEYNDGSPTTYFAILGPVPNSDPLEFYARQDVGSVITVPAEAVQLFSPKPFTFRDRQIFNVDPLNSSRISLTLDGTRTVMQIKDDTVSVVEPPNHGFASEAHLVTILKNLPLLLALDVQEIELDPETMGFDDPLLVAEVDWVTEAGTETTSRLEIGGLIAESSRRRFARVSGRPEVFHVDHGYIEDLREGLGGIVPK